MEKVDALGETAVDANGNGAVYVSGGYITGGTGTNQDGGSYVGGAIYLRGSNKAVTINAGTIVGNVGHYGAAVQCTDGSVAINGGALLYNQSSGGVINADNCSSLSLYGGQISHNTTGVRFDSSGIFALGNSGGVTAIADNGTYDIGLINGKITIGGTLTNTAPMTFTQNSGNGVFTNSANTALNDAAKFVGDNEDRSVIQNSNGQLEVVANYTVTWQNYDGTVLETDTHVPATTVPTYDGETPVKEDGAHVFYFTGWTPAVSAVSASATYTATFVADPIANDFAFTAPANLVYTGTDKTAAVAAKRGVTGMGNVTVAYYSDEACTTAATPTNVGTYYVGISVAKGDNYNAATLIKDTSWQFTVTPAAITDVSAAQVGTLDYTGEAQTPAVTTAATTVNNQAVTFTYSLKEDGDYGDLPAFKNVSDSGTVYYKVTAPNHAEAGGSFTVTLNPVDAVITAVPVPAHPVQNGEAQELVSAGVAHGGTVQYAVNHDPKTVPADGWSETVPTAADNSTYYIWYRVAGDANHNDLVPAAVRSIVREEDWISFTGTVSGSDGKAVSGARVTLMNGADEVDYIFTESDGTYLFIVPAGVYTVVTQQGNNVQTAMVSLFGDTEQNTAMSGGSTQAHLDTVGTSVAVSGLDELALAVRAADGAGDQDNVSVTLTVAAKSEDEAAHADDIIAQARDKTLTYYETSVEKTVAAATTAMTAADGVLMLAVPYDKAAKRGVAVYRCEGDGVEIFTESDTCQAGTFSVDAANGVVYIYTNRFATFAVGYTPHYLVNSVATMGNFRGRIDVTLTDESGAVVEKLTNVSPDSVSFDDVPKGIYTMTVEWRDGAKNSVTMSLNIGGVK